MFCLSRHSKNTFVSHIRIHVFAQHEKIYENNSLHVGQITTIMRIIHTFRVVHFEIKFMSHHCMHTIGNSSQPHTCRSNNFIVFVWQLQPCRHRYPRRRRRHRRRPSKECPNCKSFSFQLVFRCRLIWLRVWMCSTSTAPKFYPSICGVRHIHIHTLKHRNNCFGRCNVID